VVAFHLRREGGREGERGGEREAVVETATKEVGMGGSERSCRSVYRGGGDGRDQRREGGRRGARRRGERGEKAVGGRER
jgi:hypothetical protein